jgi:orotate phosphoribosyltransferase
MPSADPRLERLKEIVEKKAVLHGDFTLASGAKSTYYFDGRRVTHDPEGVTLVGALMQELVKASGAVAVGGPASAANAIITSVVMTSFQKKQPVDGFYVRSEVKQHGTQQLVEGNLPQGPQAPVAVVDDTMTTGGSLMTAIEAVEARGCKVALVAVVVDRQQGGAERLKAKGYLVKTLLVADGDKIRVP